MYFIDFIVLWDLQVDTLLCTTVIPRDLTRNIPSAKGYTYICTFAEMMNVYKRQTIPHVLKDREKLERFFHSPIFQHSNTTSTQQYLKRYLLCLFYQTVTGIVLNEEPDT